MKICRTLTSSTPPVQIPPQQAPLLSWLPCRPLAPSGPSGRLCPCWKKKASIRGSQRGVNRDFYGFHLHMLCAGPSGCPHPWLPLIQTVKTIHRWVTGVLVVLLIRSAMRKVSLAGVNEGFSEWLVRYIILFVSQIDK